MENKNLKTKVMNELILSKQTMSSREIAELTGKQHSHVLRDCDKLNEYYEKLQLPKIGEMFSIRQLPNGGETNDRYFELTRMQTFDLMTGYDIPLRIKVNRRWEELEIEKESNQYKLPQTYSEALRELADTNDKLIEAEEEIKVLAPKAEYCEKVLESEGAFTITIIAKELEMSAIQLNNLLKAYKIQYKSGDSWVLYAQYDGLGYTTTNTYVDNNGISHINTVWTQKGRMFIHDLIREFRTPNLFNYKILS